MKSIERSGATIGYDVQGEGPALVLGHSLLCDGRMWDPVLPTLTAGCKVINTDFRGHRRSSAPGPFSLWDLADDWLAILDAEGISRAVLCGLSMGGMTAMRLALRAPDRVAGLVLLDTSAEAQPRLERIQFGLMARIARRFGFRDFLFGRINRALFGRTSLSEREDVVARQVEQTKGHDPGHLYHAVGAVIGRESIVARIQELTIPTLVLVGEEDAATPPRQARLVADTIPGARLHTIPRAGHLTALEAPDEVSALIEGFLAEIGWRTRP